MLIHTKEKLLKLIKMKPKKTLENYLDHHYIHRSNWLRAAVLGANDGILSTASIAIGMAAAMPTILRESFE